MRTTGSCTGASAIHLPGFETLISVPSIDSRSLMGSSRLMTPTLTSAYQTVDRSDGGSLSVLRGQTRTTPVPIT